MPVARTRKPKKAQKAQKARRSRKAQGTQRARNDSGGGGRGRGPRPGRGPGESGGRRRLAAALLAGVLVCVLALGALAVLRPGDDGEGGGGVRTLPEGHPALELARRDAEDPLALGPADAPVVMIEYVDFQDAFAGIHARETWDDLVGEYVETGVLRIEFRNYPIFGPESDAAARASWAAGRQNCFWAFYRAALGEEFHRDSGRFSEEGVRELAEEAGVPDLERFVADMESEEAGEAVARDAEEAYGLGITSTPSFLVNGHPLQGARPFAEFQELIDPLYEASQ
ncbi:thioredoxin domain-containing protein [Streptomyces sp. DSM 44917]|uniref:Thioredoxin domain-containing protein n=1 Tax=Streptomyces boetiae TaxID=3075541 RepID=A0ABU2LBD0_9ACTN|nr:thioredoxin domain-containing protein [Streptomyces sp. DSM 44917]MDT0308513.1 thioredoxin domain-containing protein [Streptomyces sp. DSM 44917]